MKKLLRLLLVMCMVPSVGLSAQVVLGNGIDYDGGLIMRTHHVYLIWYGNWTGNSALTLLPDLIMGLDSSPYLNMLTTYGDNRGESVQNQTSLNGQAFVYYTHGTQLDDTAIRHIVAEATTTGPFFTDLNGIYLVLTSSDVGVDINDDFLGNGHVFCLDMCGYHSTTGVNNLDIKYAFIGNPDKCSNQTCQLGSLGNGNPIPSENGNPGADAMSQEISAELANTFTDPDLNSSSTQAWRKNSFRSNLAEGASLCFGLGVTYRPLGQPVLNSGSAQRLFLLHSLWINDGGGGCGFEFGTPPSPNPPPTTPMQRWLGPSGHLILNGLSQGPSRGTFEGTLGIMSLPSQFGVHPIFSCNVPNSPTQFVSLDLNCEGQQTGGLEGYAFDSPVAGTEPVYRCRIGADHFASNDPNCEGQISEGLLGYLTVPPPPPPPPPPTQPPPPPPPPPPPHCTGRNCLPQN